MPAAIMTAPAPCATQAPRGASDHHDPPHEQHDDPAIAAQQPFDERVGGRRVPGQTAFCLTTPWLFR